MRTRKEIKGEAKELLKANFGTVLKASLLLILLYFISGFSIGFSAGLIGPEPNFANILSSKKRRTEITNTFIMVSITFLSTDTSLDIKLFSDIKYFIILVL